MDSTDDARAPVPAGSSRTSTGGARPRIGVDLACLAHPSSAGVRRAALCLWRALARRADGVTWIPLAAGPASSPRAWRQVALPRLVRRLRLDGVHTTVSALPLATRATLVQTVHELPWRAGARENGPTENSDRRHRAWARSRRAAATVVPSRATARALVAERGGDAGIHVVHWGVGAPFTRTRRDRPRVVDRPYVVVCGATRPKKRLGCALRALAACPAARDHALVVTGATAPGDRVYVAEQVALAEQLGLRDRLVLVGAVDDARLAAIFANADAHLVVSASEGFALGVLEAAATGTPSAVPRGGAAHEVATLDGAIARAATFDDGADAEDVARALALALDTTASERATLGAAARAWSWDRTAERVVALWCTLRP